MRFTLFCSNAPKFPSVMETAAETQTSQNHPGAAVEKSTRSSTANAAALGPVDIKATVGAGAPAETSGVHIWNGAEATLKRSPISMSAVATYNNEPKFPAG